MFLSRYGKGTERLKSTAVSQDSVHGLERGQAGHPGLSSQDSVDGLERGQAGNPRLSSQDSVHGLERGQAGNPRLSTQYLPRRL